MTKRFILPALLGCLLAAGAQAQMSNVPKEITGYNEMAVTFSKEASKCNLEDADLFKAHLSDKLAAIGLRRSAESYAGVNLRITGQKFGFECVTMVELTFEGAIGKDNFVTSDERLKAAVDRLGVIPVIFYEEGRIAVQPQAQPAAGGESKTSEKAALAMIDDLVASLKAKRQ